jgi:hypothetical protein
MPTGEAIIVTYTSIDHCYKRRAFRTLAGARAYAQRAIGEAPDLGSCYAVSSDGVGKIEVRGASLNDLFPRSAF